ncbi:penicillin-binding protein [Candidatus Fermentibacteria bacterium]|nr:MAG: penicillin-binding protein [Candidatus Fermentibacteria bacterium]PIE52924.1 MAG: penicillin-binding protein [Candidatus Fermentibacteria bacterium]
MKKTLAAVGYWFAVTAVIGVAFSAGFLHRVWSDSAEAFSEARGNLLVAGLRGSEPVSATRIYDCNGEELATAFVENRYPVTLDQVSPWVIRGFIATEDRNFYTHSGIDLQGIFRSVVHNIRTGASHGGSTITQQLARGLFLQQDQTYQRKIQEAFIAMEIERQFSKNEIMEMYLNQIYYGSGAHGIEAAARTYFSGSTAAELTLAQSAMLVRMVKNPSGFNPLRNPDRCLAQRNIALSMMADHRVITEEQMAETSVLPLGVNVHRYELEQDWDYFTEYVRQYLVSRYGWSAVYEQGLEVYTTLDPEMQQFAEEAIDSVLVSKEPFWDPVTDQWVSDGERLRYESSWTHWQAVEDSTAGAPDYIQGALVAVDPSTGYIRAMVGGRDFQDSEFNRATQSRRQPGSSFKPFFYAEAIEQGWSPGSVILDQPVVVDLNPGSWRPRNYDREFHGMVTLREALARSFNVSAVRLGDAVGIETGAARAAAMGITSRLPVVNSLPLGSCMANPLEMARAYIPFANGGIARNTTAILQVDDRYGNVLESNRQPDPGRRVLSETGAYLMNSMLQSVLRAGTGTGARWYWGGPYAGREAGGKTGTTSDYADAWFVGFTPDLVASVWVGYDNHVVRMRLQNGRGQSGSSIALPVWNAFMRKVFADADPSEAPVFPGPEPGTVENAVICKITGQLANAACAENAREGLFWKGAAPASYCMLHTDSTGFASDTTLGEFTDFDRNFGGGGF